VLLNTAADGLQVDDGVVPQLAQRLERGRLPPPAQGLGPAAQSFEGGAAHDHLNRWISVTQG